MSKKVTKWLESNPNFGIKEALNATNLKFKTSYTDTDIAIKEHNDFFDAKRAQIENEAMSLEFSLSDEEEEEG